MWSTFELVSQNSIGLNDFFDVANFCGKALQNLRISFNFNDTDVYQN